MIDAGGLMMPGSCPIALWTAFDDQHAAKNPLVSMRSEGESQ
jgi:hypothetical protein